MSNDDCNPNDRSSSWVKRLSKKVMKYQSETILRQYSAIVMDEKTLTFKYDSPYAS